jgi:acyl-[acyl carrier protein]--UDP-N-acetylglucosamine O-acyltransferase
MIHPTVVTHPKAELDSDVTVGPYALVEGPIVIGRGTEIQGHALISGSVRTGKNNWVGTEQSSDLFSRKRYSSFFNSDRQGQYCRA